MATTAEKIEAIARLRALQAEGAKKLAKLERSLALETLWPEVFEHGTVNSSWHGKPEFRHANGTIQYALLLRVTNGKGEFRDFLQRDVPVILWPSQTMGLLGD